MTAEAICKELEKEGVIEDAQDLKKYLIEKNVQYSLRAGTYEIAPGADYDDIIAQIYKG
jgi:cell division protein YceG involved in septum cleavage